MGRKGVPPMSRIDGDWLDFKMKRADQRRAEYLAKYPTRWKRFLHWIGMMK